MRRTFTLSLLLVVAGPASASGIQAVSEVARPLPSYPAVASLVLEAPVIADVTIRSAVRLKPAEAAGVAPGNARFYVTVDVGALIRGPAAVPLRLGTVIDVPLDPAGRAPKLGKRRLILFGRPVPDRPAELQLTRADAQLAWSPDTDTLVRGVVREVVAADAPPAIGGVGRAFHVAGALPGEGETQLFLTTASGRPVSLVVTRRAGAGPSWGVALGDIVGAAAAPPPRDTLLWYRLAWLAAQRAAAGEPGRRRRARGCRAGAGGLPLRDPVAGAVPGLTLPGSR